MTTLTRQPNPLRLRLRLGGFITASFAAHWLLLSGWQQPVAVSTSTTALELQLLPAPSESHSPAKATSSVEQRQTQETPTPPVTPIPTERVVATVTETVAPPPEVTAATTLTPSVEWAETHIEQSQPAAHQPPPPQAVSFLEAQRNIRDKLKDDLARHFKYPHLARLRSWEGTVVLDLQIETDGKISRITLTQSSGHAMLDDNAIATLNRIGNVSGMQQWLMGDNLELQLPIVYRLSDS